MATKELPTHYNYRDAAEYLGVDVDEIVSLVKSGKLQAVQIDRFLSIAIDDLDKLIEPDAVVVEEESGK